jgi:CxxC motif-containing protein (DUF1111 family)
MKRPHGIVSLLFAVATAGFLGSFTLAVQGQTAVITEAPAGFDNTTNGFLPQAAFDDAKLAFEEREEIEDGLGPVYNAQGCVDCHQNPVTGGISQINELRAGHLDAFGNFVNAPGGSLINDRAIDAEIQERVPGAENVRTFRISQNTLGDGFVEAIANSTLQAIAANQPAAQRGQIIFVPVPEAPGQTRIGRFGWKNQQASLLGFSGDAYVNEMGITNRLFLTENTSMGRSVAGFDPVPDTQPCASEPTVNCGEDGEEDTEEFADFMRSTKVPPREPGSGSNVDVIVGSLIFDAIGCNICHVRSITTAPPGTLINGGAFRVPTALGNKVIHPFGDFLLHDIGTGDGIVQNGGQSTRNKVRTQPLWGVRTHDRHMHDGASLTFNAAILRHAGEATAITNNYCALSNTQQNQLIRFLQSL